MDTDATKPLLDGETAASEESPPSQPPGGHPVADTGDAAIADASDSGDDSDTLPPIDWAPVDALIVLRRKNEEDTSVSMDDLVASDELLFRTYREFQKGREFRLLFVYGIAVIALCFICLANRVDFDALRSNYFVQQSIKQAGEYETFQEIETIPEFYTWLRSALRTVFQLPPGGRRTAVGFILIRQLRIYSDLSCGNETFSRFGFLGSGTCSDSDRFNTSAFPADPPQWVANSQRGDAVLAQDVTGEYMGMISAENQFEVVLPLYHPGAPNRSVLLDDALANVSAMEARGFLDAWTGSISVDLLFFHPTLKRYSRASFMVEQLPSRYLVPTYFGTTFKLIKLGGNVANTTFAMDLVVVIFTILLLIELAFSIRVRYDFTRSWYQAAMSFQHFLSLLISSLIIYVLAFRFDMWATFGAMNAAPYRNVSQVDVAAEFAAQRAIFHELSMATRSIESSYQVFAMALIPISVKMMLYLQDVRGFNIIHHTLLEGLRDLVTVMTVAVGVLTFFALSGNVFFGGYAYEFLTFTKSFATLARLVVSADPYVVNDMIREQPRVGALFFFLFFLTLWLVLLNFVLGIIVSGVSTSMNEKGAGRSGDRLRDIVQRYLLLSSEHYLPYPERPRAAGTLAAMAAVRVLPSFRKRVDVAWRQQKALHSSVVALSEYSQRNPAITRLDAYTQLRMLDKRTRVQLFDACMHSVSATQEATETMERQSAMVSERMQMLEEELNDVIGNQAHGDDDPDALREQTSLSSHGSYSFISAFAASFTSSGGSSRLLASRKRNDALSRTRKFNLGMKKKVEI